MRALINEGLRSLLLTRFARTQGTLRAHRVSLRSER